MGITASISPKKHKEKEVGSIEEAARSLIKDKSYTADVWQYKKAADYRLYCFGDYPDYKEPYWLIMSIILYITATLLILIFAKGISIWLALLIPILACLPLGIIGLFSALSEGDKELAKLAIFMTPLLLSLVIRIILATITYPLYAIYCSLWNKSYHKKIAQLKRSVDTSVAEYTAAFEAQAVEKSPIYTGHEFTDMLCEKIKTRFLTQINSASRLSSESTITVTVSYSTRYDGVKIGRDRFNFEKYRCKSLPDDVSALAFGYALADGVIGRVHTEYPMDASGTDYIIERSYEFNDKDEAIITLTYSARNGNHDSMYDWSTI